MIELSNQDLYRLWSLAKGYREYLDRDNPIGDRVVQHARNKDVVLLRKVETLYNFGLSAQFTANIV